MTVGLNSHTGLLKALEGYMKSFPITDEHIKRAKSLAKSMGTLNNSILRGEGNLAGFVGEVILAELLQANHHNTYEYDFILPSGRTVDVKTKQTTVEPKPYYDCSVAAFNTKQKCDYYAFVRVNIPQKILYFLGAIPKDRYFELARFLKKGTFDGDNDFIVKADCYNLTIQELWDEFIGVRK